MPYYPNLKTTDSELRAIQHLDDSTKKNLLPIFELTRSRKSKNLPEGSLHRRMSQLIQNYGNFSFILDLCTEEALMNSETIELFDEYEGYKNWVEFLDTAESGVIIPCVLYIEDGSEEEFKKQASTLKNKYGKVCLRTSVSDDEDAPKLYRWLYEEIGPENIIVCAILYFIEDGADLIYRAKCETFIRTVIRNNIPGTLLFPGSSFPRFVTDQDGCEDLEGQFEAREIKLESELISTHRNLPIEPSDFASVHPIRYETRGGNWIPRIDIFDGTFYSYNRARRGDGGYKEAAKNVNKSLLNKLPNCWGKSQILAAISGKVTGGSPSYWISVRINCWITARSGN